MNNDVPDLDKGLSPEEKLATEDFEKAYFANQEAELHELYADIEKFDAEVKKVQAEFEKMHADDPEKKAPIIEAPPMKTSEEGLMAMGEDPGDRFPDEPYEADDVTSLAHAQLDQQRDLRQYMRVIVWDMPHLSSTTSSSLLSPFPDPSRIRHSLRTPFLRPAITIPVHDLYGRITPGREQSGDGILHVRPTTDASAAA
jgi:hypothetical protein